MTGKMINQEAIDKMIYDGLAKLPPKVISLNLTMRGEKNVGSFNCMIGTDGTKIKEKRYTDKSKEMRVFIKHLRDALKNAGWQIGLFELTANYGGVHWQIGGFSLPPHFKNKDASK